jgi:hypothetical protein
MAIADPHNAMLLSQIDKIQQQIDALQRPRSDSDAAQIGAAHARADAVASMFGNRAPQPLADESALAYRRRLVQGFKQHSPTMQTAQVGSCDAAALSAVENVVYADAQTAARNPETMKGKLIGHTFWENGRQVTEFHGDPGVWMNQFMTSGRVGRFNRKNAQ